jgi:SAM-dependent methyltransferase
VYAGEAPRLGAAELRILLAASGAECEPEVVEVAGIRYVRFELAEADGHARSIAHHSAAMALFEEHDGLLRPIALPRTDLLEDDLVTIPKYAGKTNEQLTRLLLNVTLSQVRSVRSRPSVLDPLCGRGTTLLTGWLRGCDVAGVEADEKAVEAMAAYVTGYLRRKRLKHQAGMSPVRREGRSLGRRFDAEVTVGDQTLTMGVFTGDTRQSAALWGKRRFDAIVTDAPYGIVHGSQSDVRGAATGRKGERSAAGLLRASIPVWVSQLRPGGALGLSWNTYGLSREDLVAELAAAGLAVRDDGPWRGFSHRVDSSIQRDLVVAVKSGTEG